MSLPKQAPDWADLKGAYRLLHNEQVTPEDIQAVHRAHVLEQCGRHRVVLCVQDTTELDFTSRRAAEGLGLLGNGGGRGLLQHGALAVTTEGAVLGVLDQRIIIRTEPRTGETRTALAGRWRESQLWGEAVERIGHPPSDCRFLVVADRAGDCFETMETCARMDAGFLIRAVRNRNVEDHTAKLRTWARELPARATATVTVGRQAKPWGEVVKTARSAEVSIAFGSVMLDPPLRSQYQARRVWIVAAREERPPTGDTIEPVDWLLLCSEPVEDEESARRMLRWYSRRWLIEEWHRAFKEGCRMEASQLRDARAIARLAAVLGVVAVRLLQLRDLAGDALNAGNPEADNPAALRAAVPAVLIKVVALHREQDPATFTPRQFWRAVARKGGFIGRKGDGRPGWKTIWSGWYDYLQMAEYAQAVDERSRCG
jgi:hypothetical protein